MVTFEAPCNYKESYSESNTPCEYIILIKRCHLEVTTFFGLLFQAIIRSYVIFKETIQHVILSL